VLRLSSALLSSSDGESSVAAAVTKLSHLSYS
jgi:hypothetical protein